MFLPWHHRFERLSSCIAAFSLSRKLFVSLKLSSLGSSTEIFVKNVNYTYLIFGAVALNSDSFFVHPIFFHLNEVN